jgi:hypothetical protein
VVLLVHLRDRPEALQEAIKLWSGGCGLATCHVLTILDMRPAVCRWNPLAESMEYLAVWQAEQDGEPLTERERSHPVDTFSIGYNMGRTNRAKGQVMHDGAAASRDADQEAVTQSIECCRQA